MLLLPLSAIAQEVEQEPDIIISNSEDWRDVYSVMQYAALEDKTGRFLVSNRHATLILNQISNNNHVWAVSSEDIPYFVGYDNLLQSRGYSAEEFVYENVNLELGRRLADVSKFIIIDDSYGYNAISVAPYAAVSNRYVLFADEDNINDVEDFLEERDVEDILIYGQVDREVRNSLSQYSPDVINEGGDRFLNNVEIIKRYQEVRPSKQAILTNGEFIEQEIMSGTQPVVFIGTNNVPEPVRNYIQGSDIEVGVLIGNELVGTATFVRRQLGISVFVKFAQGARSPEGAISQVEALDMFYLPVYSLNLEIDNIKYNRATNQLEVTLRNTEEQAVYFSGTYTIVASDGNRQTDGDKEPKFIDGNEVRTFVYDDFEPLPEGPIQVEAFIIYGESIGSMEKEIRETIGVESVEVLDNCEIDLSSVAANPGRSEFYVTTKNVGSVECFVDVELVDVVVAGAKNTYSSEKVERLQAGDEDSLTVSVPEFEEEDVEDNERITVRAYYGERENRLVKIKEGKFDLIIKTGDYLFYTLLAVIIALLTMIIWRRRRDKLKWEGKL